MPEVSNVSQAGYCPEHGAERMTANYEQLRAHDGPFFNHWRERIAASVGAVMPDNGG